jgi:hypothetical protein
VWLGRQTHHNGTGDEGVPEVRVSQAGEAQEIGAIRFPIQPFIQSIYTTDTIANL